MLLCQHRNWRTACGRPSWLTVDANRTNLAETLQRDLEADGTQLLDIAGEAHGQAAREEVHGRYSEDLLLRVLAQKRPVTNTVWLAGVVQTRETKTR